jgi:peptidoglycan/LPS O-acetylase OafA/YrhL
MNTRLSYLDGLRGLAALLVVIHHYMIAFYPASYSRTLGDIHTGFQLEWWLHDTPLGIVINGGLAVALFLLLSGFMAALGSEKVFTARAFVGSVITRYLRFFLLILSCNVLAFLLIATKQQWNLTAAPITGSWWWLGDQWRIQPSWLTMIYQSISSCFRMFSIKEAYNSSLWTMPMFFLGALLVQVYYAFIKSFNRRIVLILLLVMAIISSYYYLLFLGLLAYELWVFLKTHHLPGSMLIGLLLLGWYFGGYPQAYQTATQTWWYHWLPVWSFTQTSQFYHGIAAFCWLVVVFGSGLLQRLLSSRWLLYFGERSFSLYVVHIVILNSLASGLFLLLLPRLGYSLAVGISFAISFGVTLSITELLFRFVESQAKPLGNVITSWLAKEN